MPQDSFGGPHTAEKLDKLEAYLTGFLNVFKKQDWARTVYFDAFAGTGEIPTTRVEPPLPLDFEDKAFIIGSARRALGLELKFSEYVFVEKQRFKARELERLKAEYPDKADSIKVVVADANTALQSFCATTDWNKSRAVVFLDPYGNQVEWSTIEAVAATMAIDLWYLFPAGLGVHRQIGRDAQIDEDKQRSLDRLFGTSDWRQEFIDEEEQPLDLFDEGGRRSRKTATPESVTRFMIKRMGSVFEGGVLEEWLPLGSRGVHMYSLVFACANPSPKANQLARRLARAVMRSGRLGRPKRH